MEADRNNEIPRYRRNILKLLRALWKEQDFRMWIQVYTILSRFAESKGIKWYERKDKQKDAAQEYRDLIAQVAEGIDNPMALRRIYLTALVNKGTDA